MINWEAIAAGAAVGALGLAAIQTIASGVRSTVLYDFVFLQCELDKLKSLYAVRIGIRNVSIRHIEDMVLRIDMRNEPVGFSVSKTKSIDKKTVTTEFSQDHLVIKIPDMPRFEKIEFDVFSEAYISQFRPISGGSKSFVLKEKSGWFWWRFNFIFLLLAIALNVIIWR